MPPLFLLKYHFRISVFSWLWKLEAYLYQPSPFGLKSVLPFHLNSFCPLFGYPDDIRPEINHFPSQPSSSLALNKERVPF